MNLTDEAYYSTLFGNSGTLYEEYLPPKIKSIRKNGKGQNIWKRAKIGKGPKIGQAEKLKNKKSQSGRIIL